MKNGYGWDERYIGLCNCIRMRLHMIIDPEDLLKYICQ
jgi:hypothetical protein